jgi:hypothetical protein
MQRATLLACSSLCLLILRCIRPSRLMAFLRLAEPCFASTINLGLGSMLLLLSVYNSLSPRSNPTVLPVGCASTLFSDTN